jgi:sulfate permease, SulP family
MMYRRILQPPLGSANADRPEKRERERGVSVWLVGLNPEVLSVIQRSSLGNALGRERMHFNLELAVAKYLGAPVSKSAV